MKENTCGHCIFWSPEISSDDTHSGLCRRYPPRISDSYITLWMENGNNSDAAESAFHGYWPMTGRYERCGEFKKDPEMESVTRKKKEQ